MPRNYPIDIETTVEVAQNLKPGDVVELNWFHEFRIESQDVTQDAIEYLGEVKNQNDEWRVLTVPTTDITTPVLTTPEQTDPIPVVDIQPIESTLLSTVIAWTWAETEVSVDHACRARRIEVREETSQKIGECPVCSDDMVLDEGAGIVGCLECGVWVEEGKYEYWSERSTNVEYDPEAYGDSDGEENENRIEDEGTLEYWIQD